MKRKNQKCNIFIHNVSNQALISETQPYVLLYLLITFNNSIEKR